MRLGGFKGLKFRLCSANLGYVKASQSDGKNVANDFADHNDDDRGDDDGEADGHALSDAEVMLLEMTVM